MVPPRLTRPARRRPPPQASPSSRPRPTLPPPRLLPPAQTACGGLTRHGGGLPLRGSLPLRASEALEPLELPRDDKLSEIDRELSVLHGAVGREADTVEAVDHLGYELRGAREEECRVPGCKK